MIRYATPTILAVVLVVAAVAAIRDAGAAPTRAAVPRSTGAYLASNLVRARVELYRCERELDRGPSRPSRVVPGYRAVALAALRATKRAKRACVLDRIRLVSRWTPTMLCESNDNPRVGPTYWRTFAPPSGYLFALQFDRLTWNTHRGGLPSAQWFLDHGHPPTPAQQAVVASRLTYDGWPNCP